MAWQHSGHRSHLLHCRQVGAPFGNFTRVRDRGFTSGWSCPWLPSFVRQPRLAGCYHWIVSRTFLDFARYGDVWRDREICRDAAVYRQRHHAASLCRCVSNPLVCRDANCLGHGKRSRPLFPNLNGNLCHCRHDRGNGALDRPRYSFG